MPAKTKVRMVRVWDGALVKARREKAPSPARPGESMNQNEVALSLGISRAEVVRRWEVSYEDRLAGKTSSRPNGDDIGRLATLLGCTEADFYRLVPV